MSDWISVEDRLPESENPVLTFVSGEFVIASYWVTSDKHHGQQGWADCFTSDDLDGGTHWQPLPLPPQ